MGNLKRSRKVCSRRSRRNPARIRVHRESVTVFVAAGSICIAGSREWLAQDWAWRSVAVVVRGVVRR